MVIKTRSMEGVKVLVPELASLDPVDPRTIWKHELAGFLDSQTRLRQAVASVGGVQAFLG